MFQYLVAKYFVSFDISLPMRGIESHQGRKVMKKRPQSLVRNSFVKALSCFLIQIDSEITMLVGPFLYYRLSCFIGCLGRVTGPDDPDSITNQQNRMHRTRKSSGGRFAMP